MARYYTAGARAAYLVSGSKRDTFGQLANWCVQDDNAAALEILLDLHSKVDPDDPALARYRGRLLLMQGKVKEAIGLFQANVEKEIGDKARQTLLSGFLHDMVDAGLAVEAYEAASDKKQAFQMLAADLREWGRDDPLPRLLQAHRQRHPDDLWLSYYEGEMLLGEQAWDQAAQAFRKGMDPTQAGHDDRFRSRYVLALYKAGRSQQAYKDSPRKETFQQLAYLLDLDRQGAGLKALIEARRPNAGDDLEFAFFEALANVFDRKFTEAWPLFQKACEKQSTDYFRRRSYLDQLLTRMAEAGMALEGYQAAPEPALAFEILASELWTRKKDKDLELLLALHAKKRADDPRLAFYEAELQLARGEHAQAETKFKAALAKAPHRDQWMFRNGLYRASVKGGKTAAAYRELGPGLRTFEDLAHVCLQEKAAAQLEALLAEHRQIQPEDVNLLAWELELKWLKQDYQGAWALLNEHRLAVLAQPRWRWKAENYMVRCLVKLKKTDEAVRAAEALLKKRRGNQVLLVLTSAAHGGPDQALAAAQKLRLPRYQLESCYLDPDLGPLLRSEPFRPFRERFPEPKKVRGENPLE